MTEVFVERRWDEPLNNAAIRSMSEDASACFGLHRVTRHWTLLSADGYESVCHFSAPDAESVRIALQINSRPKDHLWAGRVHDMAAIGEDRTEGNVLIWRTFAAPIALRDVPKLDPDLCQRHDVLHVRSIHSTSRLRLVEWYRAPEEQSVRAAFDAAGLSFERALFVRLAT